MDELIKVKNLTKRYGDFSLENISFSVPSGTVVGLIGPNGAGKTTTLKAILGMINLDHGEVELLGEALSETDTRMDDLKQRIGVVLDTCAFPDTMKIKDVEILGNASYRNWNRKIFCDLCEDFGLEARKNVNKLSRGMGMKLSLAFALSHDPELLILDEATAGLDPIARDEILDILRKFMLDENRAILISTHITSDLEKVADEVICINDGRIIFDLSKDEICDEAGVAHCRKAELDEVLKSGFMDASDVRYISHGYGIDLLVQDRFAFARAFPDIAIDRISIEEYMALRLKGETGGIR